MCSLPVGPNECPLLAQSRGLAALSRCPLLGVKQTLVEHAAMSAFDPKETFAAAVFPVLTTPVVVRVPAAWSQGRDAVQQRMSGGYQPFAICRNRKGLSTV